MDFIYRLIGTPLGWVMWLCYQITSNYGVALLIFTLITRGAMLPLMLKQQKTTAKMQLIQPKILEIQSKYANNRQKQAEEMNALYQKEGYSPTAGCLPMLIPLLVMFGLIDVIYRPLKHILHLPAVMITKIEEIALSLSLVPAIKGLNPSQILAVQSMQDNVTPWLEGGVPQNVVSQILNTINLNFFGINLGLTPSTSMFKEIFSGGTFNLLLLIPIFSGLTALMVSLVSLKTTASNMQAGAAGASLKGMMLIMPIFSLMIAFSVPAGVGLYWTYSNLFAIGQSLLMYKFYNPKELAEKARLENEERLERERLERIEAKKQAKERLKEPGHELEMDEKALSQKEINRLKLAEARRRDAEKYGEDYVEVTDDDIK